MKKLTCLLATAVVIGSEFVVPAISSAADDIFLRIDGIQGGSMDSKHKGEIDVLSWSWGVSVPTSTTSGGTVTGRPLFKELTINKWGDQAGPLLLGAVATGAHYPSAILTVRKAGMTPVEYLKITLEDVTVTSLLSEGNSGDPKFKETTTLNYGLIRYKYIPQNPDGTAGTPVEFSYDLKNQAL